MKFLLWFFDHLPFFACMAVAFAVHAHGRTELAVGLLILGSLTEVARAISELRKELRERRCPECHPIPDQEAS